MNDFLNDLKILYEISLKFQKSKSNNELFKNSLITTDNCGNFFLLNSNIELFELIEDKNSNLNIKLYKSIINQLLKICPDYSNIISIIIYEIISSCKYRYYTRIEIIQNYYQILNRIKDIIISKVLIFI